MRQVAVGVSILMALMAVAVASLVGWRYLPGVLGETIGIITGILTTPFLLEASFAILGLVTVITLNHWHRVKEGDDFVYLEQVDGPDVPANLPEHAKWAVYREKPLAAENPPLLAQAEGAFFLGDHAAAMERISAMSAEELRHPDTLQLRLELAKATGRKDLVESLECEIRSARD